MPWTPTTWRSESNPLGPPAGGTPTPLSGPAITAEFTAAKGYIDERISLTNEVAYIDDHSPAKDGVTSDHAALVAAYNALPAGGGVIELGAGNYFFNTKSFSGANGMPISKAITIRGQHVDTTTMTFGPASDATCQTCAFNVSGSVRIIFEHIKVVGQPVASLSAGQTIDGVKNNGTAPGRTILRYAYLGKFRYNVFHPGFSSGGTTVATCTLNAGVLVYYSEIEGLGGSAGFPSMGVLAQAASGSVIVIASSIHHTGLVSDVHSHGLYVSRGYNLRVIDTDFDFEYGGRYIQVEDQIADISTNGTAPLTQKIDGCTFGPNKDTTTSEPCILTNSWGATLQILNSGFAGPRKQIVVRGPARISGCTFRGGNTSYPAIASVPDQDTQGFPAPQYYSPQALIEGNYFYGSQSRDIEYDQHAGTLAQLDVIGNEFWSASVDAHVHFTSGSTAGSLRVHGNRFSGTSTAGTNDVWVEAAALAEIHDNAFVDSAINHKGVVLAGTAATYASVVHNNFSQDGASVTLTTMPTAFFARSNYGSKGFSRFAKAQSGGGTATLPLVPMTTVTVADATAFTITLMTPPSVMAPETVVEIFNNSGGGMGAITWSNVTFAGWTWANPASTKKRYARFTWNGSNWICTGGSLAFTAADY